MVAIASNRVPNIVRHLEDLQREERKRSCLNIGNFFTDNIVAICERYEKEIHIMIDGLDESQEAELISAQLKALAYRVPFVAKVLICSRPEHELLSQLEDQWSLQITSDLNRNDIEKYMTARFRSVPRLIKIKSTMKEVLTNEIRAQHDGSYLARLENT